VLAGERGPGGFRLENPPATPPPIYVAALRGGMLRLGGAIGDGTFVNFLPVSGAERVIGEIRAGEREAGKPEGSSDVLCRFFCIPQPVEQGLPVARWMFAAYATVPVYEAFFRWLGWGEAIDPMVEAWRAGDRQRALEAAPEELIREIFVFGDAEQQKLRLGEFVTAGITTPVLTPICPPDELPAAIDALAP
jgi:alkanesulfonate monooxygenase SsuD/methylene tetrahydromethanopterin reductase-like flavin-dependent oxidoreductase (luciferase family)